MPIVSVIRSSEVDGTLTALSLGPSVGGLAILVSIKPIRCVFAELTHPILSDI